MAFEIKDGVLYHYYEDAGITDIVVPEGVTALNQEVFAWRRNLTSVTLPEGLTSIPRSAFKNCSLQHIHLPSTLKTIGERAFYAAIKGEITLPEGLTSIGQQAFAGCSFTSLHIPESITKIEKDAFASCVKLTDIVLPESLTCIEEQAFECCKSLQSIRIPAGVTSIGKNAFAYCDELAEIYVDEANPCYSSRDGALFNKAGTELLWCPVCITSYVVPDNVTAIGTNVFTKYRLSKLKSITLFGIRFAVVPWELQEIDFKNAMEMVASRNFSRQVSSDVKYAAITGFYLRTGDEAAEAYMKRNFVKIFDFLTVNECYDEIRRLLDSGKFATARNIDKLIDCAISKRKLEIQTMLIHHKEAHGWYRTTLKL